VFFELQKHQSSEEGAAHPPWPECVDELCLEQLYRSW